MHKLELQADRVWPYMTISYQQHSHIREPGFLSYSFPPWWVSNFKFLFIDVFFHVNQRRFTTQWSSGWSIRPRWLSVGWSWLQVSGVYNIMHVMPPYTAGMFCLWTWLSVTLPMTICIFLSNVRLTWNHNFHFKSYVFYASETACHPR